MLNRRKALLTGTALMIGARQSPRPTASATDGHLQADVGHSPRLPAETLENAAASCMECSQACRGFIHELRPESAPGRDSLAELVRIADECSEICIVTATLLARRGPLSPAICQACADACQRLAAACDTMNSSPSVTNCQRLAMACGQACRHIITAC